MNEETNEFLMENLDDAHNIFNNIIAEMQQENIPFEYEFIKQKEKDSFDIVRNGLSKMYNMVCEYDELKEKNDDILNGKKEIFTKYILLYIASLLYIKLYHHIFKSGDFNEIWHYVLGLFLGSTFIGLLNKDINEYNGGTKEKRELINKLKTLKEDYKEEHDKIVCEIDYIFALNDNLWEELDKGKKLVKIK